MKKIIIVSLTSLFLFSCSWFTLEHSNPYDSEYEGEYDAGFALEQTVSSVSFKMHFVPSGGPFLMGEDVQTIKQNVTLTNDFWMGETEVTQGLWEGVWGNWPGQHPSTEYGKGDDYPLYYVNWYDAVKFCNFLTKADQSIDPDEQVYYSDEDLTTPYTDGTAVYADWTKKGYRLPTEAEWEYAVRYIDGKTWLPGHHVSGDRSAPYNTSTVIGDYAWYDGNNSINGSKEVGRKKANALGLYDMSGNLFEWCYDWFAAYSGEPKTDPHGPDGGGERIVRCGSWKGVALNMICAHRNSSNPGSRSDSYGFRLCRTAD